MINATSAVREKMLLEGFGLAWIVFFAGMQKN
jgi:hypothetical protein